MMHQIFTIFDFQAYRIGTAQSNDSYLCMDRILDVAKRSGAQVSTISCHSKHNAPYQYQY